MAEHNAAFVGSVPANYDRYLGPLLFHELADDLAARLEVSPGARVLETACGTGILTERLVPRLGPQGRLVATDLNDAMLDHARAGRPGLTGVEWRQADATKLPFADGSFDAVVCQFGIMFFPDKALGLREAFRVLGPGGQYLFNVWDAIEHNPAPRITHETVASFFGGDPPQFYTVPFGFHDVGVIRRLLEEVGFEDVRSQVVERRGVSPSAEEATRGLIEGNPIHGAILERRPEALPQIKAAVARNLAATLGDRPVRTALRAVVFSARRSRR